jgi:predicted MPP superfamily phosphohydrolase
MPTQPLVWWHFSDIHWETRSSTERSAFINALLDDLTRRVATLGSPDIIFITGDLSRSGEDIQFTDLDEHFLHPIRKLSNNPLARVYMVPGNHDLRRPAARAVNAHLISSINSVAALNDFLDEPELVEMVARPFGHFTSFANRQMPDVTWGPLSWSHETEIRGLPIFVAGTNSAWASSYHRGPNNNIDDERHLLLGQSQIQFLLNKPARAGLTIFLLHHPTEWLKGFNQHHISHHINQYADVVLFGHTHTLHDLAQSLSSTGTAVYLPSPATYDRQNSDSIEYARGYSIGLYDFEKRSGHVHYFKYSSAYASKFTPFIELYSAPDQSFFQFTLPTLKPPQPTKAASTFNTFSDMLAQNPVLGNLATFLQAQIRSDAIEYHALDYFDIILPELARNSEIVEDSLSEMFWEAAVIARALMIIDLEQRASTSRRAFNPKSSAERLCRHLQEFAKAHPQQLLLSLDGYMSLASLSVDALDVNQKESSDEYTRFWILPWLLSRLLLYCDYPELIPFALPSDERIGSLFEHQVPEQLAILSYKFDKVRYEIKLGLRIQDRDGFLAVTLLKHYCDAGIRVAGELWRRSQRILPPLAISLDFPRWRNKQISDYYLSVETTPIVKLLMGKAMYREAKHVWFREIVQNALDANSARRALEGNTYRSRLDLRLIDNNTCVIRDNGIGMSRQHILRYLTTLGRSIWSSDELTEGKIEQHKRTIDTIGKFGIGFAAVFQDATKVLVRTRFFREIGETGWLVEFAEVDEPFLLEAVNAEIGTEVEIKLKQALSPKAFTQIVNDYFIYLRENVTINPDPHLPNDLSDVALVPRALVSKCILREHTATEQIGAFSFNLRTIFCYDAKLRDKGEKLPERKIIVANSGVRVFEQESLLLKPGRQYVWATETESGRRYEDPNDGGLKHYWIVLDLDKGPSPILPSRLEIEIDQEFSSTLQEIIHQRFCKGLRSVIEEQAGGSASDKVKRRAMLTAMTFSTVEYRGYWRDRHENPAGFSRFDSIDESAIELYHEYCPIWIQSSDGSDEYKPAGELDFSEGGIFVVESVAKSSLFKVYARASNLHTWVIVEDHREFFLFKKACAGTNWRGFASEKSLYSEGRRVFAEAAESPITDILRGDYALIKDEIFDNSAFIVLPSNLPGAWKRGEAASSTRRDSMKSCPARVLVNFHHPLIQSIETFLGEKDAGADQRKTLKLLFENLCDGVVEQDRTTVARERWRMLGRELRELLGAFVDIKYETLVIRR